MRRRGFYRTVPVLRSGRLTATVRATAHPTGSIRKLADRRRCPLLSFSDDLSRVSSFPIARNRGAWLLAPQWFLHHRSPDTLMI